MYDVLLTAEERAQLPNAIGIDLHKLGWVQDIQPVASTDLVELLAQMHDGTIPYRVIWTHPDQPGNKVVFHLGSRGPEHATEFRVSMFRDLDGSSCGDTGDLPRCHGVVGFIPHTVADVALIILTLGRYYGTPVPDVLRRAYLTPDEA